jgi:hypothetical protein
MPSYPGLSEAEAFIATLAGQYLAAPSEADKAGKAALEFILQDIDRILARIDAGITEQHARMDALLESLNRPAA